MYAILALVIKVHRGAGWYLKHAKDVDDHIYLYGKKAQNMASVTKQDLIKMVVVKTNKTNRDVTEVVNAMLGAIRESLENGDDVRLINFGVFAARKSAARTGVNPKTREKMEVPEKMRVKFTPGKELNDAVTGLSSE
jgi:DNA-binding protein HU-beta